MKSFTTSLASTVVLTMLTFGGVSSAVAAPLPIDSNVSSSSFFMNSTTEQREQTIHLGGDNNTVGAQLRFYPSHGEISNDNKYQLIPGDSLESVTNIVNSGPTEGVLQVYVTRIDYVTPTSLERDEWFKEVEFHTDSTVMSLYDVIHASQDEERGALILQELVDQDDSQNLDVRVVFPESATAGNESNTPRSFTFHIQAVMTDSRILDDGSEHPSGKPGKKHPPGKKGEEHPGVKNSQGKGNGKQNAPGQQKGEDHPGNKGKQNAPGQNKGNGKNPQSNGHHDNPEIRSGFVNEDNSGGCFLVVLGILSVATAALTFRKRQPIQRENK